MEYILIGIMLFLGMCGIGAFYYGLKESESKTQVIVQYLTASILFTLAYFIFSVLKG